jgi:hypothetical protein
MGPTGSIKHEDEREGKLREVKNKHTGDKGLRSFLWWHNGGGVID